MKHMHVLVVGDIMLDVYTDCAPVRLSEEAPVAIVRKVGSDFRLGGAGNVAIGLRKLNIETRICAFAGRDESAKVIEHLLLTNNIEASLVQSDELKTIVKQRIMSAGQQLLRIDEEDKVAFDLCLPLGYEWDAIVVSDYNKGAITPHVMSQVRRTRSTIIVNGKPQNLKLYEDVDVLTFNRKEYEACKMSGMEICKELGIKHLVVTLGKDGIICCTKEKEFRVEGIKVEAVDVVGAGDTVVAVLTYALIRYNNIEKAIALANLAGSVVVQKSKTAFVTLNELGEK